MREREEETKICHSMIVGVEVEKGPFFATI